MSENYFLSKSSFNEFLGSLARDYQIFALADQQGGAGFQRLPAPAVGTYLGKARGVEPLKTFFFPPLELVALGFGPTSPTNGSRPNCVIGAKACDLQAMKILDFVFLKPDACQDPFYVQARESTLVISADCTSVCETCFCTSLGISPFCEEGADLNLSETEEGFLATPMSGRGERLITENPGLFASARPNQLEERQMRRSEQTRLVQSNASAHGVPSLEQLEGAVDRAFDHPVWEEEAASCVECGACNTICPTCHCFLLADQIEQGSLARYRTWDSCLLRDFARVAGGHNPRSHLWMRLRNRFVKKFSYFPAVLGLNACTGCGRCVEACPAKIDIRRILKRIVSHADTSQSLSAH